MVLVCVSAFLLAVSLSTGESVDDPLVRTTSGPVRGMRLNVLDSEVDAFLGIPYAMPPVGELRFRRPQPIPPWNYVYNATAKSPPCFQNLTEKRYYSPDPANMTEDCLYLNFWVPRKLNSSPKPKQVMVWFYGGAFMMGSSDMDEYDGAILSAYGDVIVVSINFRVGALGFFTANIEGASGNMALYDQVLALKWIHQNVEAFGGNRNTITLFGESSGAMSIAGHLTTPLSKNYFKRAILQSGGGVSPLLYRATETQTVVSNSLALIAGCATQEVNITTDPKKVVECLRSLPVIEISKAEGVIQKARALTLYPILDDEFVPKNLPQSLYGHPRDKDILIGFNEDEGSFFLVIAVEEYFGRDGHNGVERLTRSMAHSLIRAIFRTLGESNEKLIADYYTKLNKNDFRKGIYDSIGDFLIACNTLLFADLYSKNKANTYFYHYSHRVNVYPTAEWLGKTHFQEVPLVFGMPLNKNYNFTKDDEVLSRRIMDRWLAFAKTGNPNIRGELKWPHYSYEYPVYLNIDLEETLRIRPNQGRCEFWRDRFRANMNFTIPSDSVRYDRLHAGPPSPASHVHAFHRVGLVSLGALVIYIQSFLS